MHRLTSFHIIATIVFLASSCIKPYQPELGSGVTGKYVISAQVTENAGMQIINISKSSSVYAPVYEPVQGCQVSIVDENGNVFNFFDQGVGNYGLMTELNTFSPENAYMLKVITPDGQVIESDYDRMPEGPAIDSVYYIREDHLTNDPAKPDKGIQFYIDLEASQSDSRFYRWELKETWEYSVDYVKEWYYDGSIHQIVPPDSSDRVCWMTKTFSDIYTLTTLNLANNSYKKFPLNFVDNKSTRLINIYSLLIKQYALSEDAYNYWDKLRQNENEQGGLYGKQPMLIKGNIRNVSHPDREVIGYFNATYVSSKRIFISNVPDLPNEATNFCFGPQTLGIGGWAQFSKFDYPIYFVYVNGAPEYLILECVDCQRYGGVNIKPDFWPN